jgi:phosphoglycolate phosphatase
MTAQHLPAAYAAVLFDLDGTLLDTAPDFATALSRMVTERNLALPTIELIRTAVSHGSAGLVTLAFGLKPADADFEALRQEFLGHYRTCLTEKTRLFPGIEAVLAKLAERGIPWGIVTNKPEPYTRAILDGLWLPAPPQVVVCPDHVTRNKPDPEPLLLACQQLNIQPAETLYVGDHLRDIQAGNSAGCDTAAAAYGYLDGDENPSDWGAHYQVNHPSELQGIIFGSNG